MAPLGPHRRKNNYAQVSSTEEGVGGNSNNNNNSRNNRRHNEEENESIRAVGLNGSSNRYDRLSASDEVEAAEQGGDDSATGSSSAPVMENKSNSDVGSTTDSVTESSSLLEEELENDAEVGGHNMEEDKEGGEDDGRRLTVVILDVAQKKFQVPVHPSASVATLKSAGSKVHKVSSDRQRLFYLGKRLQDDDALSDVGITADGTIIHLFPKPRVVIKDTGNEASGENCNTGTSSSSNQNGDDDDDHDEQGARVPTIVLDADEAERRSQILVLGSSDYLEAQNNVKLFSFMLLIISSIELMNLLAVALGVPQQEQAEGVTPTPSGDYPVTIDDDIFTPYSANDDAVSNSTSNWHNISSSASNFGADEIVETWEVANWVDLVISVMGVYVGIMGLQATTHNTLLLAKKYLIGTVTTGIAWMVFNFVMTYDISKEQEEHREQEQEQASNTDHLRVVSDGDIRWQALSVMVLPGMVWVLCCLRAWQFQHLLMEAEQEAEERIRSEFATVVRAAGDSNDEMADEEEGRGGGPAESATPPDHDQELALQNESARIS